MSAVAMKNLVSSPFTIVCDTRCVVVRRLAALVRLWDRPHKFRFIDHTSVRDADRELIEELGTTRWSLLLIDDMQVRWQGPESIPIILKNMPFGKIAAVLYILPGTMWLTHQLYMLVSRNHRRFRATKQVA